MKLTTSKEALLRALQLSSGVVERRQTLPVLANLLLVAEDGLLTVTGTDMEVEIRVAVDSGVDIEQPGRTTLPARKLIDIWRALPDGATVAIAVDGAKATVRSGRSRFTLATLPASDFPSVEGGAAELSLELAWNELKRLIDQVGFAMAQQDVRYFLNGMLFEVDPEGVRTVATDGHRLAMCRLARGGLDGSAQAIVPRKGVGELARMLVDIDEPVQVTIGKGHLSASQGAVSLTTKLVDGKFPDYKKVVPAATEQTVTGDRDSLRQAFHRASILSNEKYRGIRLKVEADQLTIQANNPEQEEAEESVEVSYSGSDIEIGFNVSYLQDIMAALDTESVRISFSDANSSALIEADGADDALYVVMPMRL
ncbi:MAG: DNA polymerase III subunit beta [Pseudomonadota bacterium]